MAEKRKPAPGESALWRAVTRDVRPIKREPAVSADADEAEKPGPARKKAPAPTTPAASVRKAAAPPRAAPAITHGRAAGVDRRTLDRLRRGQLAIEAEIDLHGHYRESAHRALSAFILGQAEAGRRCVRVVTGTGFTREGGGVLRDAVPRWLNEAPLREHVLAFSHARPDDGGAGALYVLLRRRRARQQ